MISFCKKRWEKEMKINEKYILVFEIEGKTLTFTGKILKEDEMFITFEDKFGKTLSYNKNKLVSFEEIVK